MALLNISPTAINRKLMSATTANTVKDNLLLSSSDPAFAAHLMSAVSNAKSRNELMICQNISALTTTPY